MLDFGPESPKLADVTRYEPEEQLGSFSPEPHVTEDDDEAIDPEVDRIMLVGFLNLPFKKHLFFLFLCLYLKQKRCLHGEGTLSSFIFLQNFKLRHLFLLSNVRIASNFGNTLCGFYGAK